MRQLWQVLKDLEPGDRVPASVHVLGYKGGSEPAWVVREVHHISSLGRRLLLVDRSARYRGADVALIVLTWPNRTLRTNPYPLGHRGPGKALRPVLDPRLLEEASQ